jgi:hypothetical protein
MLNQASRTSQNLEILGVSERNPFWCRIGVQGLGLTEDVAKGILATSVRTRSKAQSICSHQLGEPGLFPAPKLTGVYHTPSMSTYE